MDLYSATPMTTARVVRHLGYPTWRCLECCLAKDPQYAGHTAKPIIPLETGTKAIEPVPGGMRGSGPPNGCAPVRRVEEREWLPIPDPSVHHPAGLGQAHVLVRDDAVLPTALLVEESGEVPLSLVVRCHPLGGRSDVRDARRCGGVILDSSDDQAEHVSLIATCHPTT